MANERRIYLLSPKKLSPEAIAVTFAKTSRSPKAFDDIAAELTDQKSSRFHEKWVVGYGHASVAEHAVLHLALENVSRLAVETIEGNRLASYTEKSTRYQQWDEDAFYLPKELETPLRENYLQTCSLLFSTYESCIGKVMGWLEQNLAKKKNETSHGFQRRLKSSAIDACRFLLPAASLANVGVTMNARTLEYAICKMLSSPLQEVQEIGETIKAVGQAEAPTLIKYADCQPYLQQTSRWLQDVRDHQGRGPEVDFNLISWEQAGQEKVLAALLTRFGQAGFQDQFNWVKGLSGTERTALINQLMNSRGRFDQPLREFEYAHMMFEVVMDQGAYFEFKRHRMMTQTVQTLTPSLGFAVPALLQKAGCEEMYLTAMRQAAAAYNMTAEMYPDAASYLVPNGYNRRVLFSMNLREAFHFCRLRGAENAHFSIRRVAFRLAEAIREIYPDLGRFLDLPSDMTWEEIEAQHFVSTAVK